MFVLAALAGIVAAAVYWLRRGRAVPPRLPGPGSLLLPALLTVALMLLMFADRAGRGGDAEGGSPMFLAVAMDLSMSMAAAPEAVADTDPADIDPATRMERARAALLELIGRLEASAAPVMMSVTGFTVQSQPILVWDDDLPQVREVIQRVVEPGLLTRPGSDLGTGLKGIVPLFDNLPAVYDGSASERVLIVVSDGEQTVDRPDVGTALADLRSRGVRVVALHVGRLDVPEGLPLYDEDGIFTGFMEVAGTTYSVPDPGSMALIAGNDAGSGRLVKADEGNAAAEIIEFLGLEHARTTSDAVDVGVSLVLLGLVVAIFLWFL